MIGKHSIDVPRGHHRLNITTTFPMLLSTDGNPLRALPPGNHYFTARIDEACTLEVDPTEPKKPYGFSIQSYALPKGEQTDTKAPPAPPPC